jgi:hypothetical protein
LRPRIAELN